MSSEPKIIDIVGGVCPLKVTLLNFSQESKAALATFSTFLGIVTEAITLLESNAFLPMACKLSGKLRTGIWHSENALSSMVISPSENWTEVSDVSAKA